MRRFGTFIILLFIVVIVVMTGRYIYLRQTHAVSDAAFIRSDKLALVSFKVGGKVVRMVKKADMPVKKGELLAQIEARDLLTSKAKLEALLDAERKELDALRLKRRRLQKTLAQKAAIAQTDVDALSRRIEALSFRIDATQRKLDKLQRDVKRYAAMLRKRLIAPADYEAIETQYDATRDTVEAMKKERDALIAQKAKATQAWRIATVQTEQIAEIDKQIEAKRAKIVSDEKSLQALDDKIAYTKLYAPFDGVVAKKFFDAPRIVKPGMPVYAIVDPKRLYCQVLLSEKKLQGVRVGSKATVEIDALEDKRFQGEVVSVAPVSASTFSLVPRDIASGEFTKLDQRFEVRIRLEDTEGLRAGMGASVAIERQ